MVQKLLTVPEVAEFLGAARATVYAWCQQGKIPHVRVGDLIRFDPAELQTWLESRRRGAA